MFAMDVKKADKLLMRFEEGRVLVVGDVILDEFLYGSAERISPEAPVPVVEIRKETMQLGGAANVVNNLAALGARAALCGAIGNDEAGTKLLKLLHELNMPTEGAIVEIGRPTSVKTRVIAANQQVVRFDREDRRALTDAPLRKLLSFIKRAQKNFNAIVVSDYGKGVVSRELVDVLIGVAKERGIPLLVDPKPQNAALFHGATVITPNLKEASQILGRPLTTPEEIEKGGESLRQQLACEMLLVTRGEQGMSLFREGRKPHHIATRARQVYDVTGAGDTVIASFTLGLLSGAQPEEAAEIANQAAGIVVGKLGTATTSVGELRDAIGQARREKSA